MPIFYLLFMLYDIHTQIYLHIQGYKRYRGMYVMKHNSNQ